MKARYLISCGAAAMLSAWGSVAIAADVAADTSSQVSSVGEVVVTATRRSESIQKVPLTVQALTSDTLQ